jgi:transcriptional antiterminator RfaH
MNASADMSGRRLEAAPMGSRWFCLRTRPKQEHLTAQQLRTRVEGLAVYAPRIRYRKPTRRGTIWFVEALFPGYLFARFDPAEQMRHVRHVTGVTGVVAFGGRYALVPDEVVERLRAEIGDEEIRVFTEPFREGDLAEIVDGPFRGLEAVIVRVLPARERVRVLLQFLGRETEAELGYPQLAKPSAHPLAAERHVVAPAKRR